MSHPRVSIPAAPDSPVLEVRGPLHHYLTRVRRLAAGALVEVVLEGGHAALFVLAQVTGGSAVLRREGDLAAPALPGLLSLLQPLLPRRKLELVLQKATELGVDRVLLVAMGRGVARWGDGQGDLRIDRLERIAREACRQCRRDREPEVIRLPGLETLGPRPDGERRFSLCGELRPGLLGFDDLPGRDGAPATVTVAVGPEGGFAPGEADLLERLGFEPVRLGPLTLRTETASLIACFVGGLALGRGRGTAGPSPILLDTRSGFD
ncbi:MAG: 16S rRNA (uracil(1498)-N(3))-methyltransferase [Deltaproteobacteria bacterium]|nr:16S rRNA (uracil(1498)-N(3))-methyltransferase [Deltaproteobacteria bacterium]